jgi:hypothetical protein
MVGTNYVTFLDDRKEARRYWGLEEEALDRTLWRTRFGRGCEPVVRLRDDDDDDDDDDKSFSANVTVKAVNVGLQFYAPFCC